MSDDESSELLEVNELIKKTTSSFRIESQPITIETFGMQFRQGCLNLCPPYQRKLYWDKQKQSRLIVTLLSGRTVPEVFLHERDDGGYDVVDGRQRITALLAFSLRPYLSGDKPLTPLEENNKLLEVQIPELVKVMETFDKLSGFDKKGKFAAFNGLTLEKLNKANKRKFLNTRIRAVIIPQNAPEPDVFKVFEEINVGSDKLSPQQLREVTSYGSATMMADRIATNCEVFKSIYSPKSYNKPDYKGDAKDADQELVLRALSFALNGEGYKGTLEAFISESIRRFKFPPSNCEEEEAKKYEDADREIVDFEKSFITILEVVSAIFGHAKSFRNPHAKDPGALNKCIWEGLFCAFYELMVTRPTKYTSEQLKQAKDYIVPEYEKSFKRDAVCFKGRNSRSKFLKRKKAFVDMIEKAVNVMIERGVKKGSTKNAARPPASSPDNKNDNPTSRKRHNDNPTASVNYSSGGGDDVVTAPGGIPTGKHHKRTPPPVASYCNIKPNKRPSRNGGKDYAPFGPSDANTRKRKRDGKHTTGVVYDDEKEARV